MEIPETEVEKEVLCIITDANQRGRITYKKGLEYDDPTWDWLDMAIEEAADLLKYLVAQKLRIKKLSLKQSKDI